MNRKDKAIEVRDFLDDVFVEDGVNSVSSLPKNLVVSMHVGNFKLSGHSSNVKLLLGVLFDHLSLDDYAQVS